MVPPLPVARTPAGLSRGTTVAVGETAMAGRLLFTAGL